MLLRCKLIHHVCAGERESEHSTYIYSTRNRQNNYGEVQVVGMQCI